MCDSESGQNILDLEGDVLRNPNFTVLEEECLTDLISKHKAAIFSKSNTSIAIQAKDEAWKDITIEFNKRSLGHARHLDCLKSKFMNMKRRARRNWRNPKERTVIDEKIVEIMGASSDLCFESTVDNSFGDDTGTFSNSEDWKLSDKLINSSDSPVDEKLVISRKKSLKFSPKECSLLLSCVRNEKNYIMMNEVNAETLQQRNKAWMRIAKTFNSQSPHKRSLKFLKTKLANMRRVTRNINLKDSESPTKSIDKRSNNFNSKAKKHIKEERHGEMEDIPDVEFTNVSNIVPPAQDPLETVLNGNYGVSSSFAEPTVFESKEVISLKLEVLKSQLENAKLERERITELMRAEKAERESRATENSIRLRTARLEAIAAESKLPENHHALRFTKEESLAHWYLTNGTILN